MSNTMGLKTAHISNNIWRCTMSYRPQSALFDSFGTRRRNFLRTAPLRRQSLFISHEVSAIVIYYSNLKSSSFSVTSPFGAATRLRLHFEGGSFGSSKCSLEMETASGLCQSGWKRIRARLGTSIILNTREFADDESMDVDKVKQRGGPILFLNDFRLERSFGSFQSPVLANKETLSLMPYLELG